jgi:hypothetical protein
MDAGRAAATSTGAQPEKCATPYAKHVRLSGKASR